jgi:hypothetical protein
MKIPVHYRYVCGYRTRHGQQVYYLRRPGWPKIRLHEVPGTEAFDREYRAAMAGTATPPPRRPAPILKGSIAALCAAYVASDESGRLDPMTQRAWRRIIDGFVAQHGDRDAAALTPPRLRPLLKAGADRPAVAHGAGLTGRLELLAEDPTMSTRDEYIDGDPTNWLDEGAESGSCSLEGVWSHWIAGFRPDLDRKIRDAMHASFYKGAEATFRTMTRMEDDRARRTAGIRSEIENFFPIDLCAFGDLSPGWRAPDYLDARNDDGTI